MKKFEYHPPVLGQGQYHCPYCNVYAKQYYAHLRTLTNFNWTSPVDGNTTFDSYLDKSLIVTKCAHCDKPAIWRNDKLILPKQNIAPPPNSDLSVDIKRDYLEASNIFSDSPRAAAALLRLALQKLCKQLGEDGENINSDIKSLVSKGLNPLVQKSLDALRITGNNAVHPGEIDLSEEPQRVAKLFELINFIADKMITEPKEIEEFYDGLPVNSLEAVNKRDNQV